MKGIIYKITNLVNNKCYIGQSIDFEIRIKNHKKCYKRIKNKFYNAVRKYGWDNFSIEVIDSIDYVVGDENSIRKLNNLEIFYINKFDSFRNGYNSTIGGGGISGYKYSDKTKQKMSENRKGEKNHMFGKNQSQETKLKMSESKKSMSDESKKNMKRNMKGKNNPRFDNTLYSFIHKDGTIEENITQYDMRIKYNLNGYIGKVVKGELINIKGWKLKEN